MKEHSLKAVGIPRRGFEYQDLIGIELLIDFFRDPDRYDWVELESEDKNLGYLDDVVAARSDGTFDLIQVKFTANSDKYFLDWGWLLEKKPKGTSLLTKWSESLSKATKLGTVHSAQLRTNRRPDAEIVEALNGKFIDLDLVSSKRRRAIEADLGGFASAKEFFARFEFSHSEPLFDDLETHLKGLVVPTDTDTYGWLLLREQARGWATMKLNPNRTDEFGINTSSR